MAKKAPVKKTLVKKAAATKPAATKTAAKKSATGKSVKKSKQVELGDWYDYPQYFDMLFRDETAEEVAFFEKAFAKYANGDIKRLLEPGCGSGRLVAAMARKGYDVTGLDLSPAMLKYLDARIKRGNLSATTVHGDMTQMQFDEKFDAAFCTFNTFRHLLDEKTAIKHLQNVGEVIREGGLYILGFHIIPDDADPECTERWYASHGGTDVKGVLKVIDFNRRKREEMLRVTINAKMRSGKKQRVASEFSLRVYTVPQVKSLFRKISDVWEIAEVFDFDYDIDKTREFDDDLTDALFVLRRR
ncbi:class I SAM-dependent methyltransferase [Rubripirellula amarantea]|uniref:class I SAM-dependent methyltransferase n=1 Tax=Rubripirellula amarantea TaxID=2527999 RepID=UPI001F5F7E67|nr:class I SAM-dependent methyltransferase [Rubripirellula amarantea]